MSSSSSTSKDDPSTKTPSTSIFDYIPRFQVVRLPTGSYSPRVDERCFTYCSQTSSGRAQGAEPWCRTICLRHVRKHEIKENVKVPLPPEGQPEEAVVQGHVAGLGAQNVRHWQEGYYLWIAKHRWPSQEKLDIMGLSLEQQYDLMRRKEYSEKQRIWEEENNIRAFRHPPTVADIRQDSLAGPSSDHPEAEYLPPLPNYTAFTASSKLIPLSPLPKEIYESFKKSSQNLIGPTARTLEIFKETYESGAQAELAGSIWEKTKSGEAFSLVKRLMIQTWERWRDSDDDDDDKSGD